MLQKLPVQVAQEFYEAFQKKDGESMARYYDQNATFYDPVFRMLDSAQVQGMWRMLCLRGKDLKVEFRISRSEQNRVWVSWDAYYTFASTGRLVHNIVDSELTIREGSIISQLDRFDFWRWSSQALGFTGVILGWSPFLKNKVHKNAMDSLLKFTSKP